MAAIVKACGISGATPKEVSDVFSARGIARSKNVIYNALSLLVKQRKLEKKDGRYFSVSGGFQGEACCSEKVEDQRRRPQEYQGSK